MHRELPVSTSPEELTFELPEVVHSPERGQDDLPQQQQHFLDGEVWGGATTEPRDHIEQLHGKHVPV